MNKVIKKLSTTKLTRKEFLVYVGAIIIGILGIPSILELISKTNPKRKIVSLNKSKVRGFGSGAYGA